MAISLFTLDQFSFQTLFQDACGTAIEAGKTLVVVKIISFQYRLEVRDG